MIILNIFICNVFILYRDYILNLLNYVIFYLIILNWFTKLFLYGIEIIFLNIKYIYMVNFIWYRYCIFSLCFYLIILQNKLHQKINNYLKQFFFSNNHNCKSNDLIIRIERYAFTWYREITFILESILLHYIMQFIIFYN